MCWLLLSLCLSASQLTHLLTAPVVSNPHRIIGSPANPYDRHPVPAYVPEVNEFLVVFESGRCQPCTLPW